MTDRELMQQALEALELAKNSHGVLLMSDPPQDPWKTRRVDSALTQSITALRDRLAQPEQEPVIDKAAAIRIATVLGWEPPREEQEQEPTVKWDASAPLVVTPHPAFQATLVAEQERKRWHKAGARAIRMAINIEREACAKVCEEQLQGKLEWKEGAIACAAAIRARGNT